MNQRAESHTWDREVFKDRVLTHFDLWISRTLNQISMTKLKNLENVAYCTAAYILSVFL